MLALDIGNSSVKLFKKNSNITLVSQVYYGEQSPQAVLKQLISKTVKDYPQSILVFSSVVPVLDNIVLSFKDDGFDQIYHFTPENQKKITIHYENPGSDRVAAAYGATTVFPGTDLIIIDAGTAITVDAVTADGGFQGGFILPGITTASGALNAGTALLMKSYPQKHTDGVGSTTSQALSGGLDLLYRGGLNATVQQCAQVLSKDFKVCITGGDCEYVKHIIQQENVIVLRDLLASGLFEYCSSECMT